MTPLVEDVLVAGLDDWVFLAEVVWVVKSTRASIEDHDLVEETLKVIRGLLNEGLADIGDVTEGGFFEWNLPVDVAIERVRSEWKSLGRELYPGDVCWLANTKLGDERAEEILRRRGRG